MKSKKSIVVVKIVGGASYRFVRHTHIQVKLELREAACNVHNRFLFFTLF